MPMIGPLFTVASQYECVVWNLFETSKTEKCSDVWTPLSLRACAEYL